MSGQKIINGLQEAIDGKIARTTEVWVTNNDFDLRKAIHAWIAEDLGVAAKMSIYPEHVTKLIARLKNA